MEAAMQPTPPSAPASPERSGEVFQLKVRRFDPESGQAAYWEEFGTDLPPARSVLDAILDFKAREDGSLGIRCSCQAAICGSCAVRINGQAALACNTQLGEAQEKANRGGGRITVEPMGNFPVIKDLIVDMDAVHWKKIQRVVPWLLPEGDPPDREYVVPAEAMMDVTQSMACIQCGACVGACLALEVDPEFVGPAALAKAYRFVGDPRDGQHEERLRDLAEDPHGIYDCTHCFACVEVCPKGVAPMDQIMRLRRMATEDYEIKDQNNGYGHSWAFVNIIEKYGTLHEGQMPVRSFGQGGMVRGQTDPSAVKQLLDSAGTGINTIKKVGPAKMFLHHKLPDQKQVRRIFKEVGEREDRVELNLYIVGEEGEGEVVEAKETHGAAVESEQAHGAMSEGSQES